MKLMNNGEGNPCNIIHVYITEVCEFTKGGGSHSAFDVRYSQVALISSASI